MKSQVIQFGLPVALFILMNIAGPPWMDKASGQERESVMITLTQDSLSVKDFIYLVEKEYHRKFFYDRTSLGDSLWTPVDFQNLHINKAISSYFDKLGINTYLRSNMVFLTGSLVINPAFASTFDRRIRDASASPTQSINNLSFLQEEKKTGVHAEFEVIRFGIPTRGNKNARYRLSGRITSADEPVIGATIQVNGTGIGNATDNKGNYSLQVPAGSHEITIRAIGKKTTRRQVAMYAPGMLDVELEDEITEIEEVVVLGKTNDRIHSMSGSEKLDLAMVRKTVLVMGETDILRGILAMPGVQTITEVSNGFNVRGGSTDQNLILLNEAPIINASHFFGFFSSFNTDIVDDATLYKSGIPSSMGGKISSILDVTSKKGDRNRFGASGGISPVTARFALEGPILKEKLSFVAGGRTTYSDWLLKRIRDPRINNSSAFFYDLFGNLDLSLDDRTSLTATIYHSDDYFDFDGFLAHRYANLAGSLVLDTRISEKTGYHGALTCSDFRFSITDEYNPASASRSSYNITQYGWKNRFHWRRDRWVDLCFGVDGTWFTTVPGTVEPSGENSMVVPVSMEEEKALELAPFIHNDQTLLPWLSLSYGIRYSWFASLGPGTVFLYRKGFSRSLGAISDTTRFDALERMHTYHGPDFRFMARIMTGPGSSIKISYNRMRQYINLISNNITPAPTDIWKLSDSYFHPQVGDHFALGYYRDLVRNPRNVLSLSIEAYYKKTEHILDFKIGAALFANEHFETEVMEGINRSYGIELQLNKERGNLNGWISYTCARSENRFFSPYPEETINRGKWYPSNHDKPHQAKAVINYDFYRRLSLSANLNYSTGRPVTLPVNSFIFGATKRVQFTERNSHRIPDYFRADLSLTLDGRYRLEKLAHGSFTLSVVNVTGRKNPYSVFFQYDEKGRLKAYYLSIFGVPVFTITYNLKF